MLITAVDANARIVLFTRACEILTGYTSGEAVGQSLLSLLVPESWQATVSAQLAASSADEPAAPRVSPWRHKSGEERLLEWRWLRLPGPMVLGLGEELTERKRGEAELAKSERLLRDIMDNSDAVIYLKDIAGRYIHVNRHYETLTHTRREELVGKTDYDVFPKEYADTYRANDVRVVKEGRPLHMEETAFLDNTLRTFLEVKFPVFDSEGTAYGVCGIATDITERKRAEALLHESEAYFRELTQAMPIVVWTNLPDGRIDFVNRHWLDYTGQTLELVLGAPGAWVSALHPEDRARAGTIYFDAVQAGREFTLEARFRRAADNSYRWHLVSAVPLRDAANHVFKFLGTCTDIDAQKQLETALLDAARRKDQFLAMLSHELRNPLGVVLTGLGVLDRVSSSEPKAVTVRTLIRRQTEHLAQLLDDLLDVARVAQGKIELRRRPVDLRAVVDFALQSERMRCTDKAQRLDIVVPEHPVVVDGDPARLQQIVGNLINNAVKYTPTEGAIAVTLGREAGEAVVRVRDTGAGIPPDRAASIFELFTQLHTDLSRSAGGLGIGLSLVKLLVEMHGGTVEAHSEGEGRGSCFTVRLPLAREQAMPTEPAPGLQPTGGASRILLIEDNADAREVLRLGLELEGQQVDVAADGAAGMARARASRPDVVLVDIGLPDVDGYEVARGIREALGRRPFLVALTGYGQAEDRRRAVEAGFDAHVTKPATVEQILGLLPRDQVA